TGDSCKEFFIHVVFIVLFFQGFDISASQILNTSHSFPPFIGARRSNCTRVRRNEAARRSCRR
ncbi:MAG TPA: hypothetical protein VEV83_22250, partial [Parafilimonas sp.]|nr:hypothetical protein [Parafilimonas sp.]